LPLALLAHGGAIVPLAAIVLLATLTRQRKQLPAFGGVLLLVVSPWLAFTHYVDPPGNRLAKWHLAGVTQPDQRGTLETIVTSYRSLPPQQIVDNKIRNAREQLGLGGFFAYALRMGDKYWWDIQFGVLAFACFPAWLGVVALLFRSSREQIKRARP
jgi:hypothetical protein